LIQITETPPQPPPLQLAHTPSIVPLRSDLPLIPDLCCATCRNTVHTYLNSLRGWGPTDPASEQLPVPTRPIPDNRIKDSLNITISKRKYNQLERDATVGKKIGNIAQTIKSTVPLQSSAEDSMQWLWSTRQDLVLQLQQKLSLLQVPVLLQTWVLVRNIYHPSHSSLHLLLH